MSKLTTDELAEMKAIGYIEGNSATVPDALKVGQELRDKIDAHEADLARKAKPAVADDDVEPAHKPAPRGKRK